MKEVLELVDTPIKPVKIVPSPVTGVVPPIEHRFKPGVSGNPGGRPKFVTEAYKKILQEPAEVEETFVNEKTGKIEKRKRIGTRVEAIAARMASEASKKYGMGTANAQLGAAEALRKVVEPTEEESGGLDHSIRIAMTVVREITMNYIHGTPDDA